jgi:pyruvate carboxylase
MYPKVFADYASHRREFGTVSVLPTPVFFHGMAPGTEMSIDMERGKSLVIRMLAVGEAGEDGQREVFFELNGQPRMVKVVDRALMPRSAVNERADESNPGHVASPMPGLVSTLAVVAGQRVEAGDVLLTLEAMKMETAVHAPRRGRVARVAARVGQQVDAKDLLAVLEFDDPT